MRARVPTPRRERAAPLRAPRPARAAAAALLAAAAMAGAAPRGTAAARREPVTLTVLAAASLTESFGDEARAFQRAHPGVRVRCAFAGSQQLAAQLLAGADGDVYAAADARGVDALRAAGTVRDTPVVFARNRLVVITPARAPAVRVLADLARPGVRLVLAGEAVPAGHYARAALRALEGRAGVPPGFAVRALANVASQEADVRAVVAKVQLGEADAGVCYVTDVAGATAARVRALPLPADATPPIAYPICVPAAARHPLEARAFVAFVCSPEGQRLLTAHGFLPGGEAP